MVFTTLGFLSKQIFFQILLFLLAYWLFNIFIFLTNVSFFSKYVTSNQRFWRRASSLFWAIEFFVIGTYLFLILNSSVEPEWLASQSLLFTTLTTPFQTISNTQLNLSLLLLLLVLISRTHNIFLYGLVLVLSVNLLYEEFLQLFYFNNKFLSFTTTYNTDNQAWGWVLESGSTEILTQYLYLLIFLKFWHAFIVYFGLGLAFRFGYFSMNFGGFLKPHIFNLFMLWILISASYLLLIKNALQEQYLAPYFWFQGQITFPTLVSWDLIVDFSFFLIG